MRKTLQRAIDEEELNTMQDGQLYLTQCRLRDFYGKCLSTTKTTTVIEPETQYIDSKMSNIFSDYGSNEKNKINKKNKKITVFWCHKTPKI